ncbi:carboxypeptidase regulatory-like domain-containing protein [Desulfobacula sp.]|uniref:carboxypeptidase regulatory-like domain-containing protein n=1 Tax=Desulfobacula sp. TaxID=2593537 RepID=UPI0026392FC2|nr:carboxypeptidase regulatory-like domain-containing protein [Desulfobacula sp.]
MKKLNQIFIICLILLMTMSFSHAALLPGKTLSLSSNASVSNTGDDAARTATLDITLAGGSDVNGLVFTLNYNPAVFTFEGLEKGGMDIDDGSTYDPDNPPTAETIANTLYYQFNNKPADGIVMVAAAAANFFSDPFVAFKAKFKVKPGIGSGTYGIGIQKTIIGPDTAANAGYTEYTELAVAAGLDPAAEPTAAQTYAVDFVPGQISVTGGYDVTGTVGYEGSTPPAPANGAVVNLIQVMTTGEFKVATQVVTEGSYKFAKAPNGTYKVEVMSTTPGYQKRFVTTEFAVAGANKTVDPITLAKYAAKSGTVTINNGNPSGLRIEIRDGSTVIGTASVDANGNYVTPPLPTVNTYTIWAVYGNEAFDITGQGATYNWTLALGSVSGVIDALCPDQVVEVFVRSETTKLQKSVMVTGAAGADAYTVTNLLPGTDYILSMVGDGVGPVYYDSTEDYDSATTVSVTADQDTGGKDFTFNCGDLVTISGTVTVDDTPVNGVTVSANNFNFTNYKFGSAVTDADGKFKIPVAKSDDYYVFFKHQNKTYYYSTGDAGPVAVSVRASATRVDVSGASVTDIDIPVAIPVLDTAKVSGHVTLNRSLDKGGIPLGHYLVSLYTTANVPLPFVTRTGSDGAYLFEKMTPGTYNVGLLPPPPYARQFVKNVVLAKDTTAAADFIVDQNYEITGFVMDADVVDTPVASARVDIVKTNGGKLRSASYTNASGAYTLVDIPSGVYTLIASHKDYFPKSQEETVLADLTATTIQMTKGAIIDGEVSDANGIVAGATVTLAGDGYVKSVKTDKLGKYQFRGLKPSSDHIIKVAKGTLYAPYVAEVVTTGLAGSTLPHDMLLTIPVTAWTFSGTVKEDVTGTPVVGAYALLFSSNTKYQKVVQTSATGTFTFTHVTDGTDYSLLVLPGDGKPEILEGPISITADKTDYAVTVSTIATITGTITLSQADATAIVIAGAYDPATDLVHEVKAADSGDSKTFNYTIKITSGVDYKVFAQDLMGTFPLQYYVSGAASGVYADATTVNTTTANVDITLTKN